jgi:hypothetical protein
MNAKAVISLFCIALLAAASAGCHFTTAHFTDAAMSRAVSKDNVPEARTSTFHRSDTVVYCCVQLANAPSDTKVKAVWKRVDGDTAILNSTDVTAGGDGWVAFSIAPGSVGGLAYGRYAVELFIDDASEKTVPFTVAPPFTGGAVREAAVATAVNEQHYPVHQSAEIARDVPKIYAAVYIVQESGSSVVSVRWYRLAPGGDTELVRTDYPVQGADDEWVAFSITPAGSLSPGAYRADVLQDDDVVTTLPFTIR